MIAATAAGIALPGIGDVVEQIPALLLDIGKQQQGWNLFDNVANSGHGNSGSSRSYHK